MLLLSTVREVRLVQPWKAHMLIVFKNCTALETVQLSTEINRIDNEMFYNCVSLKTITIPNKVTTINIWVKKHDHVFLPIC